MFIANDKNGKRISIDNAIIGEEYFLPVCNNPLIIKAVNSKIATHFAHKKRCLDSWSNTRLENDKSEWHRTWQEKFPEQCREVVVEKNGIKHRADILINNTVIEFQHSAISHEEIERNKFYLSCGYRVVWVFDATAPSYKIKNKNKDNACVDPMKCKEDDFCWNSANQQYLSTFPFLSNFPQDITVYIQYKTTISTPQQEYNGKEFNILLLLKEITPTDFKFLPLRHYIAPENFLKEFGALINCPSVQDIIRATYPPKIQPQKVVVQPSTYRKTSPNLIEIQAALQQFSKSGLTRYSVNKPKNSKQKNYSRKPRRL